MYRGWNTATPPIQPIKKTKMITTMEAIKICRISPENGWEDGIAEYNGEFSAVYALCLYVCQYLWHTDYLNKRMIEKARNMITLGKSNRACYFWAGNDVTYSAIATSGKDAITGEFGSKYDYEPNYPTKC